MLLARKNDGTKSTQNRDAKTNTNTTMAGSWKNSTTADGSSFHWNIYYGKDVQKVCFNDAARVKHRVNNTVRGHMMVIMKVRPVRAVNEAVLNECLSHMGLTLLCTLEPGRWDIIKRMIATRTLDPADKASSRPDWAGLEQLKKIQVPNDMKTPV